MNESCIFLTFLFTLKHSFYFYFSEFSSKAATDIWVLLLIESSINFWSIHFFISFPFLLFCQSYIIFLSDFLCLNIFLLTVAQIWIFWSRLQDLFSINWLKIYQFKITCNMQIMFKISKSFYNKNMWYLVRYTNKICNFHKIYILHFFTTIHRINKQ